MVGGESSGVNPIILKSLEESSPLRFRHWVVAVALKSVLNGRSADLDMAGFGEFTLDAGVPPAGLIGDTADQFDDVFGDAGSPGLL